MPEKIDVTGWDPEFAFAYGQYLAEENQNQNRTAQTDWISRNKQTIVAGAAALLLLALIAATQR